MVAKFHKDRGSEYKCGDFVKEERSIDGRKCHNIPLMFKCRNISDKILGREFN